VLSFAHVHVADIGRGQSVAASLPNGAGGPPPPKSDGPVDPGCAICGLIQLAATGTPSAAPALPLLVTPRHVRPEAADQVLVAASAQFPFRARAPPAA
jgi:hypothetical protein